MNVNTSVEQDWRFADLVARAWQDPELAARYRQDPCGVLTQFGLRVDCPAAAPALPSGHGTDLLIEDLDHEDVAGFALNTFCGAPGLAVLAA
ncbi:MAG TPA: hypothetical protein VH912_03915 [Streptosporangiaceae bacterium]|jgi:hypothetical protein